MRREIEIVNALSESQVFHYFDNFSLDVSCKRKMNQNRIIHSVMKRTFMYHYEKSSSLDDTIAFVTRLFYSIPNSFFQSKLDYYHVIATVTKYIQQWLGEKKNKIPPLFLFEQLSVYHETLQIEMNVQLDLAEWTDTSFTITKYVIPANDEQIKRLYEMIVVFSSLYFEHLPKKIKFLSLLDGSVYSYTPTCNEIDGCTDNVYLLYTLLNQPNYRIFTV